MGKEREYFRVQRRTLLTVPDIAGALFGLLYMNRRHYLATLGAASLGALVSPLTGGAAEPPARIVRPPRLRPGDRVGLVSPAGPTFAEDDLVEMEAKVRGLGLVPVRGQHVLDVRGYLGGRDEERAADINRFFADPEIKALWPLRGGWGCARLLPYLDFERIATQPKVVVGFSDITALLSALFVRCGLVTFHGPVVSSSFDAYSMGIFRSLLFRAERPTHRHQPDRPVETLTPGSASGWLYGGNLTVLCHLIGTPYVPASLDGAILVLEDVREEPYRVDRMLTHLALAGWFRGLRAVVFGDCRRCEPPEGMGPTSLTLRQVMEDHFVPLGIPVWYGGNIGHIVEKYTFPLGISARVNASQGELHLELPAVI